MLACRACPNGIRSFMVPPPLPQYLEHHDQIYEFWRRDHTGNDKHGLPLYRVVQKWGLPQ